MLNVDITIMVTKYRYHSYITFITSPPDYESQFESSLCIFFCHGISMLFKGNCILRTGLYVKNKSLQINQKLFPTHSGVKNYRIITYPLWFAFIILQEPLREPCNRIYGAKNAPFIIICFANYDKLYYHPIDQFWEDSFLFIDPLCLMFQQQHYLPGQFQFGLHSISPATRSDHYYGFLYAHFQSPEVTRTPDLPLRRKTYTLPCGYLTPLFMLFHV